MKPRKRDPLQRHRGKLTAFMAGLILVALLAPGPPPWTNTVRLDDPGSGLRFTGISQLVSEQPIVTETGEFTLEVWLMPGFKPSVGNQEIISLFEPGVGRRPLLLGQFPRGFILSGRADNPGGDPRYDEYIGIDEVGIADPDALQHLALTTNQGGTTLHVNGRPTALRLPETAADKGDPFGGYLMLGSSNTGWRVWIGGMLGVGVYDRVLGQAELQAHAADPSTVTSANVEQDPSLLALYRFENRERRRTASVAPHGPDLLIPERLTRPMRRQVLSTHAYDAHDFSLLKFDVVSNVIGFLPLGFLVGWRRGARGVAFAVAIGLGVSLTGELAQTQIVGRASSLVDLICNGAGSLFGGLIGASLGRLLTDLTQRR